MKQSGLNDGTDPERGEDEVIAQRSIKTVTGRVKAGLSWGNDVNKAMEGYNRNVLGVALKDRGHAALKKGRLQLAINFYTQAMLHNKSSVAILSHRANAYLKLQNYEKAVEDCTRIIELQPKSWKAYALRAEAFRQQREFHQAMADFNQAKKLYPRRTHMFDELRLKCKRQVDFVQNSLRIAQLTEEAKKLPRRPYVKGDKRFTLGQHIIRMQDCLSVIAKIVDEPGYGAIVWQQDQSDRWKRMRIADRVVCKEKEKNPLDHDTLILVHRLEELQSTLKEVGIEGCHAVALAQGFQILLSAFDFHEKLVMEIIWEVCRFGDDSILRYLLHARPLPTLLHGLQVDLAGLLSRESAKAPEKIEDYAPSIWEDDVELIFEQIGETVSEFSEFHECTLRRLDLLSGYAQVAMHNAVRAMNYMAKARRAVEVLEQVAVWGSFLSLLSSFPHSFATLTVDVLAKLCRRDKRVAVHLSNLWPENSCQVVMELARSAQEMEDWHTHQAAMLILATLAGYKSFLSVMQDPTSFTILVNLFQVGQSTTAVNAGCTCLAIAVTNCKGCMHLAEMHASSLVKKLLGLWCEFRKAEQVRFQVEELLYILMKRSSAFQEAVLIFFKTGKLADFHISEPESRKLPSSNPSKFSILRIPNDEPRILGHHEFTKTGINFSKVIDFLSTFVGSGKLQPSTKFADLCAGSGLLSIQLAKHFREVHCFAVNCRRAWVEHTKRIAKHESLQNFTSVLSRGLDVLPQALPSRVNVAILCLSLQGIHDLGHLFQALDEKLLPQGKLVLIDDNQYLVGKARACGSSEGFSVVQQPRLFEQYTVVVLEKTRR